MQEGIDLPPAVDVFEALQAPFSNSSTTTIKVVFRASLTPVKGYRERIDVSYQGSMESEAFRIVRRRLGPASKALPFCDGACHLSNDRGTIWRIFSLAYLFNANYRVDFPPVESKSILSIFGVPKLHNIQR